MMQEQEYPMLPEHIIHHIKTTSLQRWKWDIAAYHIRDKLLYITLRMMDLSSHSPADGKGLNRFDLARAEDAMMPGTILSMSPAQLRKWVLTLWKYREQLQKSGYDFPVCLYGSDRQEAFLHAH